MRIIKITFEDGSEESIEDFKTREQCKDAWEYRSQFDKFDKDIIEHIDEDAIEHYAEWNLSMVKEDDVEEKELSDFSDREILQYCKESGIIDSLNMVNNPIAESILEDMLNLFKKYSLVELSEKIQSL
jgi:hypothetical protein